MSRLSLVKKPADKPAIITVAGEAGLGKTTFAASFPKPIFMQAEEGLQSIPSDGRPDAFPPYRGVEDVENTWKDLAALIQEDHEYKTLVIDSVTSLEELFIEHVVASDPRGAKNIAQAAGGYGAGFRMVASMHQRIRKAAGILRDRKGMHVVFIAHTETENIDPPDGTPYSRLSLRLNKRSRQPYIDNVDAVALITLETYRKTSDGERPDKAISDGTRVMKLTSSAAHVSKNRYGITEDLILTPGINPLAQYIPSLKQEQ